MQQGPTTYLSDPISHSLMGHSAPAYPASLVFSEESNKTLSQSLHFLLSDWNAFSFAICNACSLPFSLLLIVRVLLWLPHYLSPWHCNFSIEQYTIEDSLLFMSQSPFKCKLFVSTFLVISTLHQKFKPMTSAQEMLNVFVKEIT